MGNRVQFLVRFSGSSRRFGFAGFCKEKSDKMDCRFALRRATAVNTGESWFWEASQILFMGSLLDCFPSIRLRALAQMATEFARSILPMCLAVLLGIKIQRNCAI